MVAVDSEFLLLDFAGFLQPDNTRCFKHTPLAILVSCVSTSYCVFVATCQTTLDCFGKVCGAQMDIVQFSLAKNKLTRKTIWQLATFDWLLSARLRYMLFFQW